MVEPVSVPKNAAQKVPFYLENYGSISKTEDGEAGRLEIPRSSMDPRNSILVAAVKQARQANVGEPLQQRLYMRRRNSPNMLRRRSGHSGALPRTL